MKSFKILFIVLALVLIVGGLFTCGNKDIEKSVNYLNKMNEFAASEGFLSSVKGLVDEAIVIGEDSIKNFDNAKFSADFTKVLDTKGNEIAKEVGMKDLATVNAAIVKHKDNSEIKELLAKYNETIKKLRTDLEKEGTSKASGKEEETTEGSGETVPGDTQQ
jgi:ABC-type Na+ efflux pump permease subunit